jgi:hypothetical protein
MNIHVSMQQVEFELLVLEIPMKTRALALSVKPDS